jgi:hypothetical protein
MFRNCFKEDLASLQGAQYNSVIALKKVGQMPSVTENLAQLKL